MTSQRFLTSWVLAASAAVVAGATVDCRAGVVNIGAAADYAVLYEGLGGHTLQITNVTVNGNIGVGNTGQTNLGGPGAVSGRLDFQGTNSGQLSGGNVTIAGGVQFNVAAVMSALDTVNSLNTSLGGVNGTNVSIGNSNTLLNASNGVLASGAGFTNARFFDVTSYGMGNNSTLTIQGNGSGDAVVLNFTSSTNFNGQIELTGGLTPDQVIFNFVGGANGTGGPTLQINNQGDGAHPNHNIQGIFIDPNGAISVVSARINQGRVFGGDTHDFQLVSGSSITSTLVPLPSAMALSLAALGAATIRSRRRR